MNIPFRGFRFVFVGVLLVSGIQSVALAQGGSLTPPGAPAPTMKTLDQIEPRTPISSLPFTISTPGSYYLTGNVSVTTGDGITIAADNVTLDLSGFTLSSTASPASGTAALLTGTRSNVAIRNGNIRGTTTVAGNAFTTGGFLNGISQSSTSSVNLSVADVRVTGVGQNGINLSSPVSEVRTISAERCTVAVCAGAGISADTVRDCVVNSAGGSAISTRIVTNSHGESVGTGSGIIGAFTVGNCRGVAVSGIGVSGGVVHNSQGVSTSNTGVNAGQASNSSAFSTSGTGMSITNGDATNCTGSSSQGIGLSITNGNAMNCSGTSTSGSFGMNVGGTASFCRGQRDGGVAIQAGIATGCTVNGTGTINSLAQGEPRVPPTPVTSLPLTISQSGSYCLTKSFSQNFTIDAISVQADNVTLDFCGFTIQQTTANAAIAGVRIESTAINTPLRNAVIRNGTISGFNSAGIISLGGRNCLIENFSVTGCSGGGISFQAFGTAGAAANTFRRCRTGDNAGGSGIVILSGAANIGNVIENCESLNNTTGFAVAAGGNLIIGCRASGNTSNNYTIAIGNRGGIIVLPGTNAAAINGSSGGTAITTDPFANLSY